MRFIASAFIVAFTLFTLLSGAPLAVAQSYVVETSPDADVYGDFVVSPGRVEIELKPGQSYTAQMSVSNRLGSQMVLVLSTEDIAGSSDPEQSMVFLGDDRGPSSLRDFVRFPAGQIVLGHAEQVRIPVTISIPTNARPGGLYGSVIIDAVIPAEVGGDPALVGGRPFAARAGTILLVRVSGTQKEEGRLIGISAVGGQKIFSDAPVSFDVLFENNGDVHLDPRGLVTVTNMLGSSVGQIEADAWLVLPDSARLRTVEWKDSPFLFGRYVAQAEVYRGYGGLVDRTAVSFWVIPWKIILALLAGLGAAFILIKR